MLNNAQPKKPHEIIDDIFIETLPAKHALAELDALHKHGTRSDCCECMLLTGPSRAGKSAIIRHYQKRFPEWVDDQQVVRPVLVVELNADAKLSALIASTLQALGDPRPDHGTPRARTDRALKLLERQRTEIVVYEEFQHLIDSDTDKIAYKAGDQIKTILNARLCKVLLSGVTRAEKVVHTNEQLIGRLRAAVRLGPVDWRDPEDQMQFRVFLHNIEKALELPSPSNLGSFSTAHRIHHFARGLYGYAYNLIRDALLLRYLEGEVTPCLTEDQFIRTADKLLLREPVERLNAFRVGPPEDYEPAPFHSVLARQPRNLKRTEANHARRLG